MTHLDVLKTHGSRNDIFVIDRPTDGLPSDAELRDFVRALCDRAGPLGGDGAYFLDSGDDGVSVAFFNPDGSSASLCGNGMRGVARLVLDRLGADSATVRAGTRRLAIRRAETTPEGVRQTVVELPHAEFAPGTPIVSDGGTHVARRLPGLNSERTFTAVAVPNPHLISIVDDYDEAELIEIGKRVAAEQATFPVGANVSFVVPLSDTEVFVRTYERGAGLTLSCGSGVAAARVVYSRIRGYEPERPLLVRNAGGPAMAWLREADGSVFPSLAGNATFVYRARVDVEALISRKSQGIDFDFYEEETAAYDVLGNRNEDELRRAGIRLPPA